MNYFDISFPELFFLIPVIGIILLVFIPSKYSQQTSLLVSFISVLISIVSLFYIKGGLKANVTAVNYTWLDSLGSMIALRLDGANALMCLLNTITIFFSILISKEDIKNKSAYYVLIFILQIGLHGVFMSYDAFSFYIYWELVLIPTYFLCGYYGGQQAHTPTLKFFIYTFAGSILMLFAILYYHLHDAYRSFNSEYFKTITFSLKKQYFLMAAFFIAFAIKMPLFPLHTWQPKLYSNSPIAITLILSSVMVKMGLVGLTRWVLPLNPDLIKNVSPYLIIVILFGIIYTSLIAIKQKNLKLVIAY